MPKKLPSFEENKKLDNEKHKDHDLVTETNVNSDIAIKLSHITKTFLNGAVKANTDISFEIKRNDVHALIGENGAGKSTLTSIIFGLYEQDSGEIFINGEKVKFKSAADARRHKIGMVHQHFKLVENYNVIDNIILGVEPSKFGFINYFQARKKLKELIAKYNFNIRLNDKISSLSVGQQQKVEILKLLFIDADILIFDEPTAVLSDIEIKSFLQMILDFKSMGKTIIIISHKLNEIKEVADNATVIRHGKVVGHYNVKKSTVKQLAEAMVGRTLKEIHNTGSTKFGDVIVKVDNLPLALLKNPNARVGIHKTTQWLLTKLHWSSVTFEIRKFFINNFVCLPKFWWETLLYKTNILKEEPVLNYKYGKQDKLDFENENISLEIRAGEIFAIAGVEGNGQSQFVEYISGLKKAPYGTVFIKRPVKENKYKNKNEKLDKKLYEIRTNSFVSSMLKFTNNDHLLIDDYIDVSYKPILKKYKWGLSFIPEDRHKHGLFLDESIAFNTVSNQMYKWSYSKVGFMDFGSINHNALKVINDFDVRGVASLQDHARGLSGGNQQKLIVGREMNKNTDFIIFTQPTRGLDLGAIEYIHSRILRSKEEGKAILLISYELDEILSLADTITVFNKNKISGMGSKKEMTREKIAECMVSDSIAKSEEIKKGVDNV